MNGLEFLKSRPLGELLNFKEEEIKYNIIVPPKFLLFINSFDTNRLKMECLLWDSNKVKYPFAGARYTGQLTEDGRDSLVFERFIHTEDFFAIYDSDFEYDEEGICSKKYIPFGISGLYNSGGGFMIGTLEEECDKVIIDTESFDPEKRFRVIANDIFEFVRSFKLVEINLDYVDPSIKLKKRYKNWEEDFWRLGDAKEES